MQKLDSQCVVRLHEVIDDPDSNNLVMVIGAIASEKPSLSIMFSDNLVTEKDWNAGSMVRELAKEIQGGGGGQAFFATAGGKKVEGLDNALSGLLAHDSIQEIPHLFCNDNQRIGEQCHPLADHARVCCRNSPSEKKRNMLTTATRSKLIFATSSQMT